MEQQENTIVQQENITVQQENTIEYQEDKKAKAIVITVLLCVGLFIGAAGFLTVSVLYALTAPVKIPHEAIDLSPYSQTEEDDNSSLFQSLMDTPTADDGIDYSDEFYDDKQIGDYIYRMAMGEEYKDRACLIGYVGTDRDITLPQTLGGYEVISVAPGAFEANTVVRSVTIPEGYLEIGSAAFHDCTSLEEIIIPQSVTSIGNSAFLGCTSLKSIEIPNNVKTIEAFTFYRCGALKSVKLPNGLQTIGNSAFAECTSLESVIIPDSVTLLEQSAFSSCSSLRSATVGKGVTQIADSTFYKCKSLTETDIRGNITSIGSSAFRGSGLTEFEVPEGVSLINHNAFLECADLQRIYIPSSVSFFGNRVFYGCSSLEAIEVDAENPCYHSVDGVLFNTAEKTLMAYTCGAAGEYTIPDGVTAIGYGAFAFADKLTGITFSESVSVIGELAFEESGLTSADLTKNVTEIGSQAFYKCERLASVSLGKSISAIGDGAFSGCKKLGNISIDSQCTKYAYENRLLADKAENKLISVIGTKSGVLTIPEGITALGEYCAFGSDISEVILPSTLESIGAYAFSECSALKSVVFGGKENTIGFRAFSNTSLERVILPNSLTTLGQRAFSECTALREIQLNEGLTMLDYNLFENCTSLKTLIIPESVTELSNCLVGCTSLERVILSNNLEKVSLNLFDDCIYLREIYFPVCLEFTTGDFACTPLQRIYYAGTKREWQLGLNESPGYNGELDYVEIIYNSEKPTE